MGLHFCPPTLRCTPSRFNRPKDVQGCSAAPEALTPTAFPVLLLLFLRFPTCVCVRVCAAPEKFSFTALLAVFVFAVLIVAYTAHTGRPGCWFLLSPQSVFMP